MKRSQGVVRSFLVVVFLLAVSPAALSSKSPKDFPYNYQKIANTLIGAALNSSLANFEYLCDTFGPRYRGTPALANAIDWIQSTMQSQKLNNISLEPVHNITNWIRGHEFLEMVEPASRRGHVMAILGLGRSVGTSGQLVAEALVVSSFDELKANASLARGKIVVYNAPFVSYGQTVQYRVLGASEAAKVGAVAALVRSITPFSLYTPHTGVMAYESGVAKIPTAAITIEDAEMMARMQARGQTIKLKFFMEARTVDPTSSYNVIAEVEGAQNPEEVVVMGGHIDSWDVGQGAMDDGGGIFSAWEALNIINSLVLEGTIPRPKRTVRLVMWVDEEISGRGAVTYYNDHKNELNNHVMAMESDSGNFIPFGFGFSGTKDAYALVSSIGSVLLSPINAGNVSYGDGADADNGILVQNGVPGGSLLSRGFNEDNGQDDFYFFYHHSNADSITSINPDGMRVSIASFAVMSYVVADMDEKLPR